MVSKGRDQCNEPNNTLARRTEIGVNCHSYETIRKTTSSLPTGRREPILSVVSCLRFPVCDFALALTFRKAASG